MAKAVKIESVFIDFSHLAEPCPTGDKCTEPAYVAYTGKKRHVTWAKEAPSVSVSPTSTLQLTLMVDVLMFFFKFSKLHENSISTVLT